MGTPSPTSTHRTCRRQSLQTHLPLLFSAPSPLDGRAGLKQLLQNPTAPWESTLPPLSNATALHRAPQSLLRVWQSQTPVCGGGMLGLHQRCPSRLSLPPSPTPHHCLGLTSHLETPKINEFILPPPVPRDRGKSGFSSAHASMWLIEYPWGHRDLALDSSVPAKVQ